TQPATGETYPKSDLFNKANIRHTVRYTASNAARFAGIWERNNLIGENNAEARIDTTD
ncbi:hypothetical protein ABLV54_12405, partial [Klebsiella sp. JB_Kp042]